MENLHVTLEQHPAVKKIHGVPVPMFKNQRQVKVNGVRVAYVGAEPGKPLCFIRDYPETFVDAVTAEVERQLGGAVKCVRKPPAVVARAGAEDLDDAVDEEEDDAPGLWLPGDE